MRISHMLLTLFVYGFFMIFLSSCATTNHLPSSQEKLENRALGPPPDYASRLPSELNVSSKTLLLDPNVHAWGAYDSEGELIKAGLMTAGADYCPDIGRSCRTSSGTFHVHSLGNVECKSRIFPVGKGGAPMPYCMFFHGGQAVHGSPWVVEGNISHGCVRVRVADAEWLRFNFVDIGTRVIVRPY